MPAASALAARFRLARRRHFAAFSSVVPEGRGGPVYICSMPSAPAYDPAAARAHLSRADRALGRLIRAVEGCGPEQRPAPSLFASLAEAIVYQQLSGRAAATIFGRVRALYPGKRFPTPADLLATPDAVLRSAGLSGAKTAAIKDLARHAAARTIPSLAEVRRMDDEAVIEALTVVRGIGRWTVEMLLMFRLGRPDVLPVGDLGVRKGFALTYRLDALPPPDELAAHAERWRPFRSVGSWYMWRACELYAD